MFRCRICGNAEGNTRFVAREMMFGLRDEFEYFQCASCGCLQIGEVPADLSKYYPADYYSFHQPVNTRPHSAFKYLLKRQRLKYSLGEKTFLGRFFTRVYEKPWFIDWLTKARVKIDDSILDVGCGDGFLLGELQDAGFRHLTGIDPSIERDICYANGVRLLKQRLEDVEGQFDFIMLHMSFEHLPNPLSDLRQLYRLLKPKRSVLIRIPVVPCYAWREYGVNWVQLDPPRHLYIHTAESIKLLADQVGFEVTDIVYDSTEFQFWGSEQYLRDIPLRSENSYSENPEGSSFSQEQIDLYKAKAGELNKVNDGDQACFYLYKK